MGSLFYNQLRLSQGTPVVLTSNINGGPLYNIQPYLYWSCAAAPGTSVLCQSDPPAPGFGWSFSFGNGFEGTDVVQNDLYAMVYYPDTPVSSSYQGVWGGGASENGWGLAFMQHGNTLVAGWYYYGANGKATWTIMPGCTWNAALTSCTGALYNSTGAWLGSYNAASFSQGSVGTMTLTFTDASNGSMQYTVNGVSGTKAISRLSFGSGTAPGATNYSDVWGGGTGQNGWGVVLAQEQAVVVGSWYTYNKQGQAMWYLINGGSWTNATTFSAQLTSATGSPLIGATYNPGLYAGSPAGSIVFTFSGANDAAMSYTVDGVTQTKNISRLQF
jgi:hypothetical protein